MSVKGYETFLVLLFHFLFIKSTSISFFVRRNKISTFDKTNEYQIKCTSSIRKHSKKPSPSSSKIKGDVG